MPKAPEHQETYQGNAKHFEIKNHDELVNKHPILAQAEKSLEELREKLGEIREVLTPQIQEETIYSNPEIFAFFEFLRQENLEEGELDFLLEQFGANLELPYGSRVVILGSGWGITGRRLAELRPDLYITHVDINPHILNMDTVTNMRQGFVNIKCLQADATDPKSLREILGNEPVEITSVGLVRYLTPLERERLVQNLVTIAPKGSKFVIREVNPPSMAHLKQTLFEKGIGYLHEESLRPHLRYTRFFAYYHMYHQKEPFASAIKEVNPDFDFEGFKQVIDGISQNYPQIDIEKIFGEVYKPKDLRHLLVLADLAGYDIKKEEILIFHN